MGKRLLDFLVYSNLFIAAGALALTYESFCLLQLPATLHWYLLLVFCCTVFIYCLHYFVKSKKDKSDSRLEWCRKNADWLKLIILISFLLIAGGIVFHFRAIFETGGQFNYRNLAWFIIIPLLALGYSYPLIPWHKKSLRQIGWLKMTSLSFIWSFTTVVLPVLMLPGEWTGFTITSVTLLFLHRFIFIAALSFLFNINDYEEDKEDQISTIAVGLGPAKSIRYGKWLMPLLNGITALLILNHFDLTPLIYYAALFIPVGLLFLLYHYFSPLKDEAIFVIRYDGLMIIKSLLLIFALLIGST